MNEHHADLLRSEQVITNVDPRTGLRAVIALDDITLGPGLGGVRMRRYESFDHAVEEAQRLAAAMTLKNALAGLPYGGAKAVIVEDGAPNREARIRRFGELVAGLDGRYLPGVDMGTTPADLEHMAAAGADATCSEEDPSPWTALGVYESIRSGVRHRLGATELTGIRVLVQGAGSVGARLAELLVDAGARVTLADVDSARCTELARQLGASVLDPTAVIGHDCDVFAPCAVARVVTSESIERLSCSVIAGGANDTLEDDDCAQALADAGILYVPDFMANAGGVVHIHGLREGWDEIRIAAAVRDIGARVTDVLDAAMRAGTTPLRAAHVRAYRTIEAARRSAASAPL